MSNFTTTTNPATGEQLAAYRYTSPTELKQQLQQCRIAQQQWRTTALPTRSKVLIQLATALDNHREKLALAACLEMGKPITEARAEVKKCIDLCQWYAEHGPALLAAKSTQVPNNQARQQFRPLGIILAVMPWNFPYWQVLRGAVGMLLAGNGYILKPAANVMGAATILRDISAETDLPAGVFTLVHLDNPSVANLIADDAIAAVAVTASVKAGRAIAELAGREIKKTLLELGGSDPFIVLADADLEKAVAAAVIARYQNTGQVCIAAKRFILDAPIAKRFEQMFVAAVSQLQLGDPQAEQTQLGPMARSDLRDELHQQVLDSLQQGARLVCGGERPTGRGNFYPATILADVSPEMTVFQQEVFGPVATLTVANDHRHALQLANNSEFGLSATVWTAAQENIDYFVAELETGAVFINRIGVSDPRVSIGGIKKSGYGRELGELGLYEFCNIQTIWQQREENKCIDTCADRIIGNLDANNLSPNF